MDTLSNEDIAEMMEYVEDSARIMREQKQEIARLNTKLATAQIQIQSLNQDNNELRMSRQSIRKSASVAVNVSFEKASNLARKLNKLGFFKLANINDNISRIQSDPSLAIDLLDRVTDMLTDMVVSDNNYQTSTNNKYASLVDSDVVKTGTANIGNKKSEYYNIINNSAKQRVANENYIREKAFLAKHNLTI